MQRRFLSETAPEMSPTTIQAPDPALERENVLPAQNSAAIRDAGSAQTSGEELEPLARRFQRASRRHRMRVRRAIWLGVGSALGLMTLNVAALLALLQTERYPFAAMWGLWLLNAVVLACCIAYPLRSAQERRTIAVRLAGYEDVRVVGPLIELLTASDKQLRKTARIGLIRLLPRMTPLDAHWLTNEQMERLGQVLEHAEIQPELADATLRAFAQVGDSSVLPLVRRVAEMRANTSRHRALRAMARECLPLLCARVQHETARQTLLRIPMDGKRAPNADLLRPSE